MKSLFEFIKEGLLDANYGTNDDTSLADHILKRVFNMNYPYTCKQSNGTLVIEIGSTAPYVIEFGSLDELQKIGIKKIEFVGCSKRITRCYMTNLSDISITVDGPFEFCGTRDMMPGTLNYELDNVEIKCPTLKIGAHQSQTVSLNKCKIDCKILVLPKQESINISNNCRIYADQLFLNGLGKSFNRMGKKFVPCFGSGKAPLWVPYLYKDSAAEEDRTDTDIWKILGFNKSSWPNVGKIVISGKQDKAHGLMLYNGDGWTGASQYGSFKATYKDGWNLITLWNIDDELNHSSMLLK